jgi:O-antigen/teichoic acid export membrane protein
MTSSGTSKIIRGIFSLSTSSMVRIIVGFAATAIAARLIPEEDYGVFFIMLALVGLLEIIGNMGLRLSATKFIAGAADFKEQEIIVNNFFSFRLFTIIAVVILAIVGKPLFLLIYPYPLLSALYYYVPIIFTLQLTESTLSYVMQGFQLYRKMAVVEVSSGILYLVLVCLFLFLFKLEVHGIILATIIQLAFSVIFRFVFIPTRKGLAFNRDILHRILRFSIPMQGNEILYYINTQLDTLLVGYLLTPASVVYLEIGRKIPNSVKRLMTSINSVYFPHFAQLIGQGKKDQAEWFINNFLRLTTAGTLFMALLSILFQDEFMIIFFSDRYLPSAPAFGLLMTIVAIGTISQVLDSSTISAGFPGYLLIVNVTIAIVSITGNLLLIPIYGFMGAVYAGLIANLIGISISYWCVRRVNLKVKASEYIKPAFILVFCLSFYFALGSGNLLFKFIIILLFIALTFLFSVITIRDIKAILEGLKLFPLKRSS